MPRLLSPLSPSVHGSSPADGDADMELDGLMDADGLMDGETDADGLMDADTDALGLIDAPGAKYVVCPNSLLPSVPMAHPPPGG